MSQNTGLGMVFSALAQRDPHRPALICADRVVTSAELDAAANKLARIFLRAGATQGSFITIALPNGALFVEAVIAAWKIGAVPQPVSPALPSPELQAIVDLARPAVICGLQPSSMPDGTFWVSGDVDLSQVAESGAELPDIVSPAWKAPTSGGSTGRPKIIVAGEPATLAGVQMYIDFYRMSHETVLLSTGPLYHNGPLNTSMLTLAAGGTVIIMERFDAHECLRLIRDHSVTWLYLVPTMMSRILELPSSARDDYDISSLEIAMHTAAPCPVKVKRDWVSWLSGRRLIEIYGGTEAQMMTWIDGDDWLQHPTSVGRPAFGEVAVRDRDGSLLPPEHTGAVWMRRGPEAPPTYHYVGAEAITDAAGWEWLGDLGHVDDEGYLYLSDRESDMILVGGANVYPAEVEAALELHSAVESACVVGLPDDDLGSVPHAVLHLHEPVEDADLEEHLTGQLARYKRPRSFSRSAVSLRDAAGKVRRSDVRAHVLGALGQARA